MTQRVPRPRRIVGPVVASVLTIAAWTAVGHNSGSGWVQAIGALLAAFLGIGLLGPALAVARARVTVVASPGDATARDPVAIEVGVSAPLRLRPVDPPGEEVLTGGAPRAEVRVVPPRRGERTTVTVVAGSAAPFGLVWWERRMVLALARPLLVAPATGEADRALLQQDPAAGEDERRVDARVGEPRGVRPYRPGDLRHWVHWPATAHTGTLMVREMEGPAARPVVVDVVLPPDADAAERTAERAMATVGALLGRGRTVDLCTTEATGARRGLTHDTVDAGRRLARAVPGAAPAATEDRGMGDP